MSSGPPRSPHLVATSQEGGNTLSIPGLHRHVEGHGALGILHVARCVALQQRVDDVALPELRCQVQRRALCLQEGGAGTIVSAQPEPPRPGEEALDLAGFSAVM